MKNYNQFITENNILVYTVDDAACKEFCKTHTMLCSWMKKFKPKENETLLSAYKRFLKEKDKTKHEDMIKLGYKAKEADSPTFGKKTFYNIDWGKVKGHYPEIFQYLMLKK